MTRHAPSLLLSFILSFLSFAFDGIALAVNPIPPGSTWLWDLEGGQTSGNADVIDYDPRLGDKARRGQAVFRGRAKYVICYFSAGTWEASRPDMGGLQPSDIGAVLKGGNSSHGTWDDNGKPERILNVESPRVQEVMRGRLDDAAARHCDGVEPDNVDVVKNKVAYMKWLSDEAHKRNLVIGLKNADDLAAQVVSYFDFVIIEQCLQYSECDKYDVFVKAGKAALEAEYRSYSQSLCDTAKKNKFSLTFFPADQNVRNGNPCK